MDLDKTTKLLRSVLLTSKHGIPSQRLQQDFNDLAGCFIAHKKFGHSTLHSFLCSLSGVVRVQKTHTGDTVYHAIADASTQKIQKLVAGQKQNKKAKRFSSSYSRNLLRPVHTKPVMHMMRPSHRPYGQYRNNYRPPQRYFNPLNDRDYMGRRPNYYPAANHRPMAVHVSQNVRKITAPVYVPKKSAGPTSVAPKLTASVKGAGDGLNVEKLNETRLVHYKENVIKLLRVNASGIHSDYLADMYKKTFREVLPQKVVSGILSGEFSNVAYVESFKLEDKSKTIVFPFGSGKKREVVQKDQGPNQKEGPAVEVVCVEKHKALEVGKSYTVSVTCFFDCDELYVQLLYEEEPYQNLCLKTKEQKHCSNQAIKTGMFVLTPLHMRAKVLAMKGEKAIIFNIDVGSSHQISVNDLTPMHSSLASPPEFAICCSLHRPDKSKWNQVCDKYFEETFSESIMKMKVIAVSCDTSSKDDSMDHSVVFFEDDQNVNSKVMKMEKEFIVQSAKNKVDPMQFQPQSYVMLPKNDFCNLYILAAPCTTEMEACIIGEGFTDKLVHLETLMKDYYCSGSRAKNLPRKYPVDCVYAIVSKDNCVRGRLLSVEGNQAKVYLVDNGEYETVNLNALRALNEKFAHLPMQTVLVGLAGLDSNMISNHCEILDYLNKEVIHKTFAAKVVGQISNTSDRVLNMVDLINVNDESNSLINEVCINLVLDQELAAQLPDDSAFSNFAVSHVNDKDDLVYIQVAGKGLKTLKGRLDKHLALLNMKRKMTSEFAHGLYIGKICLSVIKGELHRVQIEEFVDDNVRDTVIFLIDSGSRENVARCSLLKLESESLFCIPRQALCCKISDTNMPDDEAKKVRLADITKKINRPDCFKLKVEQKDESGFQIRLFFKLDRDFVISYARVVSSKCSLHSGFTAVNDKNCTTDVNENLCDRMASCSMAQPLGENKELYHVKVLDVESPNKIQVITTENLKMRDRLREEMNKHYQNLLGTMTYVDDCMVGKLYAMLVVEKGMPNWYRIRVESRLENLISVYFVDYGTFKIVRNTTNFRLLDKKFEEMLDMVWFARLAGVEPVTGRSWPKDVTDRFSSFISFKYYFCHTLQIIRDPTVKQRTLMLVALCDTTSSKDIWINDMLVDDWKCAKYLS